MGEAIIVKTLEDPEIGIALVTSLQIVEAAYLELRTVHMDDLDEARNALAKSIEDSFDVHLSNFMEQCTFLGANQATVSPVEMIRTLYPLKTYRSSIPGPFDSMNFTHYLLIEQLPTSYSPSYWSSKSHVRRSRIRSCAPKV